MLSIEGPYLMLDSPRVIIVWRKGANYIRLSTKYKSLSVRSYIRLFISQPDYRVNLMYAYKLSNV